MGPKTSPGAAGRNKFEEEKKTRKKTPAGRYCTQKLAVYCCSLEFGRLKALQTISAISFCYSVHKH